MVNVKAFFERPDGETEIRRLTVEGDTPNFKALVDGIAATFPDMSADEIHALHWKDEDGDFIAFSSDKEFREALRSMGSGVLKVYIRVQTGFEQPGAVSQPAAAHQAQAADSNFIKFNQFEVDENGQPREPFWVWFFRGCVRRCVVKAWFLKEKANGADVDVNMSPDDMRETMLPDEFRDWLNLVINETILRAMMESQKECTNRCPFSVPPFFFHNVNRCIRKSWIKMNGIEDEAAKRKSEKEKEGDSAEKKELLPKELVIFFRRDAVVMWHRAVEKAWQTQNQNEAQK